MCTCCLHLQAQSITQDLEIDAQSTQAIYLGKTKPIRELIPVPSPNRERRKKGKLRKKVPTNFAGRGKYISTNPNAMPQGEDEVWQKSINRNVPVLVEPLVNVDGIGNNFGSPHDPSGDIGKDHYLQAINATQLGVFDKEGNLENTFTANTIWSQIGFSSAGDPIILYDQEAERWLITEFPNGNQLLVAISEDSDPMGAYTAYNFATPNFPDYPKYAIWSNAYVVTTNEQGPGNLPGYFIDRDAMLAGEPTVNIQRITVPGFNGGPGFQVSTPVDWSGATQPVEAKPIILNLHDDAWGGSPNDEVIMTTFDIDFDDANNTTAITTNVPLTAFDSNPCSVSGPGFSCMPQAGNGGGIDGLPEVIMNQVHYRNFGTHESIIMSFIVDVSGGQNLSGIRWTELRRMTSGDWEVYQEGTFAPEDGLDRYMPGIAMDGSGNIGLAYNCSSEDIFVGVRYTGRRSSDPLGEMTVDEFVAVEGTNTISSGGRFGDYAQMGIDPTNDRAFWYTTEYGGGGGSLSTTRIVAFELGKDTTDIGPTALLTPQTSPDLTDAETVQIEVRNFGLDTQSVFQVGYIFENGTAIVDDVNFELLPDATYMHTFTPTVDMSAVGSYEFKIFTGLAADQAPLNDTLRVVVSKLPRYDVGIINISGLEGSNCETELTAALQLTNFGTETLTNTTITVNLNGNLFQTIDWTGSLESGASETVNVTLTGFLGGTNTINAATSLPNGETDETPANDGFEREFEAILGGVTVTLELLLDGFPTETTWEVTDDNNAVVFSGGPYAQDQAATTVTEEWCLDPEACYTFTIADSYGDGISAYGIDGNYEITDASGNVLASILQVDFGFEETNDFCATFACMLEADIDFTPETVIGATDGTIMLTPMNGVGPFMYSIDGGQTFQNSNLFTNLAAGDYDIVITGDADCEFSDNFTIPSCTLNIFIEVENASTPGNDNGSIVLELSGGTGNVQYSIDGGETFQSSPIFENLPMGTYNIVIEDGNGCSISGEAEIDLETSTSEFSIGQSVKVFPNPTDGVFRIEVKGLDIAGPYLNWKIYNAEGKFIYAGNLVKYDDTFTGLLSLKPDPSGVYFVKFEGKKLNQMVRVLKK